MPFPYSIPDARLRTDRSSPPRTSDGASHAAGTYPPSTIPAIRPTPIMPSKIGSHAPSLVIPGARRARMPSRASVIQQNTRIAAACSKRAEAITTTRSPDRGSRTSVKWSAVRATAIAAILGFGNPIASCWFNYPRDKPVRGGKKRDRKTQTRVTRSIRLLGSGSKSRTRETEEVGHGQDHSP